ncbi:MAG: DUF1565 domain-containing protein [bacterium]|nr:DUF1565 domain-containing protein [bacterium]
MKLHTILAAAVLSPCALASDWYVDAGSGSNSNGGTSPSDAWRTITYGLAQVPTAGAQTVHVAGGTYDASLGESFPLVLRDELEIVGAGVEATVVSCTTSQVAFYIDTAPPGSAVASVERLTVRGAQRAFRARANFGGCLELSVADVRIEGCQQAASVFASFGGFLCHFLRLSRVDVRDCQSGISAQNTQFNDVNVVATECSFERIEQDAFNVSADMESVGCLELVRTRVLDCETGIRASHSSSGKVYVCVGDSLIANCDDGLLTQQTFTLNHSTIANHQNFGVSGDGTIESCVLYGSGADLDPAWTYAVSDSNVGSSQVPGNGNISVDPLFRGPEHGDFRLGFGTGCVDAVPGGGVDLTGFGRGNDGNLDLAGAGDMGALELRTLDAPATVGIGGKLHIDLHAEPGACSVLWLARSLQLAVPDPTPFGDRWLPEPFLELVATRKVPTAQPIRYTVYVPDLPVLIGQPFSFQALSRSSAAPAGAAWTDAVTVRMTP